MVLRNQFVAFPEDGVIRVRLFRWYHHCFTYDYSTGRYQMFVDGHVLIEGQWTGFKLGKLRGRYHQSVAASTYISECC